MSTFSIEGKFSEHRVDRELFLELGESPVHPEFISFQPPLKGGIDPHFHLELNCKLFWLWRRYGGCTGSLFKALQLNLKILGYGLHPDAFKRIGHANFVVKKMKQISKPRV